MTNEQKREMFEAAFERLVLCVRLKNPPDMRDRWLTSVFAYHMNPNSKSFACDLKDGRNVA